MLTKVLTIFFILISTETLASKIEVGASLIATPAITITDNPVKTEQTQINKSIDEIEVIYL